MRSEKEIEELLDSLDELAAECKTDEEISHVFIRISLLSWVLDNKSSKYMDSIGLGYDQIIDGLKKRKRVQ